MRKGIFTVSIYDGNRAAFFLGIVGNDSSESEMSDSEATPIQSKRTKKEATVEKVPGPISTGQNPVFMASHSSSEDVSVVSEMPSEKVAVKELDRISPSGMLLSFNSSGSFMNYDPFQFLLLENEFREISLQIFYVPSKISLKNYELS